MVIDNAPLFGYTTGNPTYDEVITLLGLDHLCLSPDYLHVLFSVAKGHYEEMRYNDLTASDILRVDQRIRYVIKKDSMFQYTDGSHFRLLYATRSEIFGGINLRPEVKEMMALMTLMFTIAYSRPESFDWSNISCAAFAAWRYAFLANRLYKNSNKGALFGAEGGNGGLYMHELQAHFADMLRLFAGR